MNVGDSSVLAFCAAGQHVSAARRAVHAREPATGTDLFRVPSLLGPFDVQESTDVGPYSELSAGKVVRRGASWYLMGFVDTIDRRFIGELADPQPFDPSDDLPSAASHRRGRSQHKPRRRLA